MNRSLADPAIVRRAVADALVKLDPRRLVHNPILFVVEAGSVLTTLLFLRDLPGGGAADNLFAGLVAAWLWFTVLFANFARPWPRAGARLRRRRGDLGRHPGWRPDRGHAPARRADGREGGAAMSRVLVVDDDRSILKTLELNLCARGYQVDLAPTGEAALDLAARHHPDVVILDLGLPGIDGVDVVRGLRGWSTVPILVLSARGTEAAKIMALDAGADDYVTKPFGMGELLAGCGRRCAAPPRRRSRPP